MNKLNKYMVYNPKHGKPKKYYSTYFEALNDAKDVSRQELQDVLILQVVALVEPKIDFDVIKEEKENTR